MSEISESQRALIAASVPSARLVSAGTGLTGGGDLSADRTIALAAAGAGAGTYGTAGITSVTLDAYGRVTAVGVLAMVPQTTQVIAGTGLSGGGALSGDVTVSMPAVGPGAGLIGGSGIASVTLDAQGRVTAAATATYLTSAAPTNAQYLTLATDATLTVERVFTPSTGLTAVDGGAGGAYTMTNDVLTGKAGGQEWAFDTASGAATGNLTSTFHATKGKYYLNHAKTIAVDELNARFGIGNVSPSGPLHVVKAIWSAPTIFGDALTSNTGFPNQVEIGNTTGNCGLRVGQDATHNLGFNWAYNATAGSANGQLDTYGFTTSITIDAASIQVGTRLATCNLLLATTANVASTILRVNAAKTVSSIGGLSVWDGIDFMASTLTLSGSTNVTTATGVNFAQFRAPTITSGSVIVVTNAATVAISGAPGIAGSTTITNAYALWVQAGIVRVDGRFQPAQGANIAAAATLTLGVDGNGFTITGNTNVDFLTTTGWRAGARVVLVFTGTPTVNHNTGSPPASTAAILLAGSANLTAANNTVLGLYYDGTVWQETFRKAA